MVKFSPMAFDDSTNWLLTRRWYGDKSRQISELLIRGLASIEAEGLDVELCLFGIVFSDGESVLYFAPIQSDTDDGYRDAFDNPRFVSWWADGFATERALPLEGDWSMHWHSPVSSELTEGWTILPGEVFTGEQSNTSVAFGTDAILKTFRKWQPGVNPDSEIVEFLTEQTEFRQVPGFLGSIRLSVGDGTVFDVATVQTFVGNQGDCWKWLPPSLMTVTEVELPGLVSAVGLLGQRTGELHAALATGIQPDFAPESIGPEAAVALRERVFSELLITCERLAAGGAMTVTEAAELGFKLQARLGEADGLVGSQRIRVHGDYHLGQVLRVDDDFVIIDFEGEPSRSMSERREKHSPLKDVAGMLRSIDYAVAAATFESDESQQLLIQQFGSSAHSAFLAGYREGVAASEQLIPQGETAFDAALDVFIIEKALYETRYELDNRPSWLPFPLAALQRIAKSE